MRNSSPLRYPGGKAQMASLLCEIRRLNGLGSMGIIEPFAGGAGASLTLLYKEDAEWIQINDADSAISSFWWTLTNRVRPFLSKLSRTRVSLAEWRRQRQIYLDGPRASKLRRGFATFYLNRCNRSGIIKNGGPIGGVHQRGEWKLNARFNKPDLLKRCSRVHEYRRRISTSNEDGLSVVAQRRRKSAFLFIDPPYVNKGPTLYLNELSDSYHSQLATALKNRRDEPWVLTYDDCPEIRELYSGWASLRPFSLRYVASERRAGRELMITPGWMELPAKQASLNINW